MEKLIDKLNASLRKGKIPDELNFTEQPVQDIDYNKIKYNAFYRSYEFAASKFPPGYEQIPGFDKIIDSCRSTMTPLEELEMKAKQKLEDDSDESDERLVKIKK
jgi:hypothetical protein